MVEYGAACYQPATLGLVEVCEQVSVFKLWVEQLGRRPGYDLPAGPRPACLIRSNAPAMASRSSAGPSDA
jgi:hypothetical protein